MKMQKISLLLAWMLVLALLTSCEQPTNNAGTSFEATLIPNLTHASDTKTPVPTLTLTPNSTNTLVAVPTLSMEDAHTRLLELLANNGDCRLPCLWGISPGKSNYQEGRVILLPLSSVAETVFFDSPYPGNAISLLYIEGDSRFNTSVSYLYGNEGIVSRIAFRALEEKVATDSNGIWLGTTPIYGLPSFIKRVEYYSLAHLLSEQGLPAAVMVTSAAPSANRRGSIVTEIAVLYPNQGISAQYTTLVNEDEVGSSIKSCPINAHIEMDLYPAGNSDSFYTLLDETDWGITKDSYKPIEEATSMSVEQFYETFRQPTDKCIETPTKLWPTPER